MKLSLSRTNTRLAAAAFAVIAISAPAYAGPSSPEVPPRIVPPAGKVFLVAHAEGVQIYECNATTGAWTLRAPRAVLYGENSQVLGTHSMGPIWIARDGSYVIGRRVDGVNVDPTAVDWLLLERDASASGADGDRLAGTKYIQRINTVGGRAPAASECDVAGEAVEVAYSADYHFWK